ncbi:MAG: response regulator [Verrucomicrobia bacterium]|jgi:CheY-like chemotaxis protein|nr:response regulator [Verrucomicrobiota bacterium]
MAETEDKGATILLVDDNKHLVITLTDYLTYEGFEVVSAKSGEEALRKLEQLEPDLVILDISMPGIGGIGFLNKVQQNNEEAPFPILVFTARSAMEEFFGTLNVAGFVAKPCAEVDLLSKINEVLDAQPKPMEIVATGAAEKKVLLGENDVEVVKRLSRELEQAGFSFHLAETGAEILETAAVMKPDAIVMKNILPGMNGRVVAPLIRAMPSTKSIPIILYDATCSFEEESRYGRRVPEGVTQYLTTDESDVLLEAIRRHTK